MPIARRVAEELIDAVLSNAESADSDYRLVVK